MSTATKVILLACLSLCCCGVNASIAVKTDDEGKPIIPFPRRCRMYTTLLALDGGGLKGIITTQILIAFQNHTKTYLLKHYDLLTEINRTFHYDRITDFHIDLADYFDAIAGISAGSWIATYIASKGGKEKASEKVFKQRFIKIKYGYVRPGSLEGLEVFFLEYGTRIYPQASPFSIARPRVWPIPWTFPSLRLTYLTVPAHPVQGLEYTLKQFLGDIKLSEVSTSLLVVAFDLNTRSAMQFVHDKVEPNAYNLRRLYVYHAVSEMDRLIKILKTLQERHLNKTEDCISASALKKVKKRMEDSLDTEAALKGEGRWRVGTRFPVKSVTSLGTIENFVNRRNTKDWKDYKNPGMHFENNIDFYLRDVARASSAFPILHEAKTLHPIGETGRAHEIIDGAMVGNNPTMQAWVWLMRKKFVRMKDVATLSIGTGTVERRLDGLAEAGSLQWYPSLTPILLDDSSEFQQSALNALFDRVKQRKAKLKNQSLRIQVKKKGTTPEGAMLQFADTPGSMKALKMMGRQTAGAYFWNLKDFVEHFTFGACNKEDQAMQEEDMTEEFAAHHNYTKAQYERIMESVKTCEGSS